MSLKRIKSSIIVPVLIVLFSLCMSNAWAVKSGFAAIEVIGVSGKAIDAKAAITVTNAFGLPSSSVYVWKNHLVVYGEMAKPNLLRHQLEVVYPQAFIKMYANPFYDFDRAQRCKTGVVKQWDNILLTCNLVADPKMQQEYLNYHATQFQKWPEVSQGFCNAQFQQLLVFRNGRQLMLVISIPHGADLNNLNPLTSKDNPRVDEWNKLMSKYQQGIPGTKKGETWVFLEHAE